MALCIFLRQHQATAGNVGLVYLPILANLHEKDTKLGLPMHGTLVIDILRLINRRRCVMKKRLLLRVCAEQFVLRW